MEFDLTPEQELLQRTARALLVEAVPMSHVRAVIADPAGAEDAVWERMAALGWHGLAFPEQYGGAGLGMTELAMVLSEMGRVVLPAPFLSTVVAGLALQHGGDEAQRQRWLPGICAGRLKATLAFLETSAEWDPHKITLAAHPRAEGLAITGSKPFVFDAHAADVIVCVVRRADDGELALVLLERDTQGLEVALLPSLDPTRPLARVTLHDVVVAPERILAGRAGPALARALDLGRVALAAEMSGGAERVLELTVEHAKVRHQFDRPIGSFQAIQHKCADMLVEVEKAKAAALYAAWASTAEVADAARAAATAKAIAGDAYRAVTAAAIQIHGGIGFTWEHDLHVFFRRALSSEAMFGDATWSRELVAQHLGL